MNLESEGLMGVVVDSRSGTANTHDGRSNEGKSKLTTEKHLRDGTSLFSLISEARRV